MRTMLSLAPLLAVGLLTSTAQAQQALPDDGPRCFNGYAYTLDSGDYRYTEHHEQQWANGRITDWSVTYVGDGGETIATKQMQFAAQPTVPTYTMEMANSGYREGIENNDGSWVMFKQGSGDGERQTENFDIRMPMAADSGFDVLVRERFDDLTAGETVPFRFAAAGRQAVIKLRAKQTGTTQFEGSEAVVFNAELDMWLVNFFVDSLKLTYDPDTRRLLEYEGIGNIHNDAGEVYPVRVTYASEMPAVARDAGAPQPGCSA